MPLRHKVLEDVAGLFGGLGHPTRVRILAEDLSQARAIHRAIELVRLRG